MKIEKIFLIYCYTKLAESNARLFDAISTGKTDYGEYDFSKHTELDNQVFLKKWKKENGIVLTDYKIAGESGFGEATDKYGTPYIVKKVARYDDRKSRYN